MRVFLFLAVLLAPVPAAALTVVPLPLASPVEVDIVADPVVLVGPRLIDFTPFLGQEFITFLAFETAVGPTQVRETVGIRARDGLVALAGVFPPSPDPAFTNQVPAFTLGTSSLILFDVLIAGSAVPFSLTLTDLHGRVRQASFQTPIPEPGTIALVGAGLLVGSWAWRRRARR